MTKDFHKKSVSFLVLGSFVLSYIIMPVYLVYGAGPYEPDPNFDYTQYNIEGVNKKNSGSDDPTGNASFLGDTNSYKLNISTISEAIPAVIGCTGIVNKVQSSLSGMLGSGNTSTGVISQGGINPTGNYKSSGSGGVESYGYDDQGNATSSTDTDFSSLSGSQNVPVAEDNSGAIKESSEQIKKREQEAKTREECLNGIAYSLAKAQLAKMTQITVNWINSGFEGDPLYIRDRESYFQSIADGQLLSLVGPLASIQNQYIYPFGRSVARSLINSSKYNYETKASSTLYKSLKEGSTTQDFANDFSVGGWDGWFSLTQNDQNNPLGFGIMTSQELADRINKKQETATAELLEGKGFLSQKKCAEYAVNKRADGTNEPDPTNNGTLGRECIRWETVTPGSLIQDQASSSLTSSTRQLELADSLNESLSAVFQALVNQMISQGLNSLSSFNPQNAPKTFGGLGDNKVYDALGNDITNLSSSGGASKSVLSVNKGRGWYNANGTFDITTDLGDVRKVANGKFYVHKKGIISIQKDYNSAVKLSLSTLPRIMPALGELDYCIPGPNANWEVAAKEVINKRIEYLQSLYFDGASVIAPYEDPLQPVADLASSLSPSFAFVRGLIVNNKRKYEASLQRQEDNRIAAKQATFEEQRRQALTQEVEQFKWYKERIDSLYGPESPMRTPGNPWYLPMAEAGLQSTKYIREYNADIKTATKDYQNLINQTNANIYKLNVIKGKVDKIVAAARKRRALEMEKRGIPMIDPSCYDLDPIEKPNQAGGVTGPSNTSGDLNGGQGFGAANTDPKISGVNNGASTGSTGTKGMPVSGTTEEVLAQFTITIKEDKGTCEATVYGNNKTTGQPADINWGLKLSKDPTVYGQKNVNFENKFSTYSQSGFATLTLTVKDQMGKVNSLSKSITIPERKLTSKGTSCPR